MSENNGASELIQRYLNGIATESEIADLNKLLTENPEVADAFVLATRHDSKLENYFNIEKTVYRNAHICNDKCRLLFVHTVK